MILGTPFALFRGGELRKAISLIGAILHAGSFALPVYQFDTYSPLTTTAAFFSATT